MNKINWLVRFKSKPFLAAAFAELLVIVYAVCNVVGVTLPFEQEAIANIAALVLQFLALLGIIADPTTPGVEDSSRALSYVEPGVAPEE